MRFLLASIALLAAAGTASACEIATPSAIYCTTGPMAVLMARTFGPNPAALPSHDKAIIHGAGCALVERGAKVERLAHRWVPTMTGWVGVSTAVLNGKTDGLMVDVYLAGECKAPPVPSPQAMTPLERQ